MAESAWGRLRSRHLRGMLPRERPMHELSIAMSIVDMALEEAESRNVKIDAVHLELGPLSGVVAEALLFSYQVASSGTRLEGSRLVIREVPIEVYCPACKAQKSLPSMQWFCCPECGTATADVIHGRELAITALEVRDECRTASVGSAEECPQAE
jgi:hydrogenase nickel incorporation protein HypA/HybF